ncbi:MAG: GGDEF domain-containing protein [Gammaproteobacteria bacterium]|nr:MAG: GGDEF domain-containing protein [Gammaproteobacteria bacterium]UCH38994.1 MAG: GGDEF domain-containing protein [Gammaproteobacteria bacterium]
MSKSGNKKPECPVGESSCEWLDEVEMLRRQIGELSDLVSTDALTGLFNFRHFKTVLQAEMDRSKRSGIPTSLVLVDADHFKAINDTHGHEVGNQALRHLADILRGEVRTTDIVCRYGGEEFAMIFPETHLNLAVKVADRIREEVATSPVRIQETEINLTVSMGASVYMKTSVLDIDDFIDSVDKYLFEAKQSGRNCICHIDYADLRAVAEVGVDERALLFNLES